MSHSIDDMKEDHLQLEKVADLEQQTQQDAITYQAGGVTFTAQENRKLVWKLGE